MGKTGRYPCSRQVANITGLGGWNMHSPLLLGIDRHIGTPVANRAVACGKRSGGAGMAHDGRRKSGESVVTGITSSRRWNVVTWFAKRIGAVVAG